MITRSDRVGGAVLALFGVAFGAGVAAAQGPATLSLPEALELARANNPAFLAARNDEFPAGWAVREAYGDFLPSASVSAGARYEDGGAALFGSFTASDIGFTETPSYYFSDYSANLSVSLSGQTVFNLQEQRAAQRAVSAGIRAEEVDLETAVTRAYLAVLRSRDVVELRRQELERAGENLRLAETRAAAGVAIPLDAQQAQVEQGRAQVDVLTAQATYETAKLRLLERLGIDIETEVTLTTELAVFEPRWTRASLQETALAAHPVLRSLEAREQAQRAAAKTAWSAYLPTLTASARLSGFTRQVGSDAFLVAQRVDGLESRLESCRQFNDLSSRLADPYPAEDCSRYQLTDRRLDSLRLAVASSNRAFPFDFQQQPLTVSLRLSVPVFTGFTRQRQVAEAEAAAEDTEHERRGERLRLEADVAAAYLQLQTAYQAVQLEETNREVAASQLQQARERYRVGLDSFIQLTEAETLKSQADQAYLSALYTFHEALADLEAAVGQPLRPDR
ncbi:MAG: TolC family protein [Longimicrobiales bacterium]|nr:TolC family protein [Longimicrobiales bacterium]